MVPGQLSELILWYYAYNEGANLRLLPEGLAWMYHQMLHEELKRPGLEARAMQLHEDVVKPMYDMIVRAR